MTAPRREHPVANIGFPGVVGIGIPLLAMVAAFWPALVWHGPDGPMQFTTASWVGCGIWWGLLAAWALVWVIRWIERSGPAPKGKRP